MRSLLHTTRWTRRAPVAVIAAFAVLTAASPAGAYVLSGQRWPGHTITYYVAAKGYARSIDRAAANWNHAHVGVRLRRTYRSGANVTIRYGGGRCNGQATVGYAGRHGGKMLLGRGCPQDLMTLATTHEFGHVLGLGHEERGCARMNPVYNQTGTPNHCHPHSLGYWLAHPLVRDDVRGARHLYG